MRTSQRNMWTPLILAVFALVLTSGAAGALTVYIPYFG